MAIYINGIKHKTIVDNTYVSFNIGDMGPKVNGTMLISSDSYILKDSNGLYLTSKESE